MNVIAEPAFLFHSAWQGGHGDEDWGFCLFIVGTLSNLYSNWIRTLYLLYLFILIKSSLIKCYFLDVLFSLLCNSFLHWTPVVVVDRLMFNYMVLSQPFSVKVIHQNQRRLKIVWVTIFLIFLGIYNYYNFIGINESDFMTKNALG